MKKKGDNSVEVTLRVHEVVKLILRGYSKRSFLLRKIAEDFDNWGLKERQIEYYISDAKKLIKDSFTQVDLEYEKGKAIDRLESLFTMNSKIQDFREARMVVMDLAKLLGLVIEKSDITTKGDKITDKIVFVNYSEKFKENGEEI